MNRSRTSGTVFAQIDFSQTDRYTVNRKFLWRITKSHLLLGTSPALLSDQARLVWFSLSCKSKMTLLVLFVADSTCTSLFQNLPVSRQFVICRLSTVLSLDRLWLHRGRKGKLALHRWVEHISWWMSPFLDVVGAVQDPCQCVFTSHRCSCSSRSSFNNLCKGWIRKQIDSDRTFNSTIWVI